MICKNCGAQLREGAQFCGGCGQPVTAEVKAENETAAKPKERKTRKKPVWPVVAAIVLAALLLLGAVGAATFMLLSGKDDENYASGAEDADETVNEQTAPETPSAAQAVNIELSLQGEDDEAVLALGEDKPTFRVAVEPAEAQTELSFASSDEGVALVDSNGTVTPVAEGSAVITVRETGGLTDQFRVIVKDPVSSQYDYDDDYEYYDDGYEYEEEYYDDGEDYYYPYYDELLTNEDLDGLGYDGVILILNEIYARNGYIFKDERFKDIFGQKSWYQPVTASQAEAESRMSDVDKKNVSFITNYIAEQGWKRKQQN